MKGKCKLKTVRFRVCGFGLDAASLQDNAAVVIYGPVVEELVIGVHQHTHDLGQLLSLAVEHFRLEPTVHPVVCPFRVGVEVQVPVVYSRHMDAVSVELNHVHMVAAVAVALLVLDHDEEYIR